MDKTLIDLETRIGVVETVAVSALGIVMASASNDPDGSKGRAILNFIRDQVRSRYSDTRFSKSERDAALFHSDRILSLVSEHIDTLHKRGR